MDILFKSHFILTEELLLECRSIFAAKRNIILGWFLLFLTLFSVFFLENDLRKLFVCISGPFSSIMLMLIIPKLRAKRMYKQLLIINNNKPAEETVNFYNDRLESISANGMKISVYYDDIKKVHNKENMLVFVSKQNLVTFVKKDGFEDDTYDDFKTFIYNKSNLSF